MMLARRSWLLVLGLGAGLAVGLAVLGWMTVLVLRLDAEERSEAASTVGP